MIASVLRLAQACREAIVACLPVRWTGASVCCHHPADTLRAPSLRICQASSGSMVRALDANYDRLLPRQVHSTQRNVAANTQRKFVSTYCVPAGYEGGQLTGTPPVEMTGVLMMSVSPSGASPTEYSVTAVPNAAQRHRCAGCRMSRPKKCLHILL